METKKPIKISLSAFFLIFTIIIILVLGCLTYSFYTAKSNLETEVASLKENNQKLIEKGQKEDNAVITKNTVIKNATTNSNLTSNSEKKDITFDSISGVYTGTVNDEGNNTKVTLKLEKDGTYSYNNVPGTGAGNTGYYTITENNISLHILVINSNDPSVTIPTKTKVITLKINDDGSITDDNVNDANLKAILKKDSTDDDTSNVDICATLTEKHKENAIFFEIDR